MDAPAPPRTRLSPGLDAGWAETTTRLRAFIARRVDNPHIADDITQDVLTRSLAGGTLDTARQPDRLALPGGPQRRDRPLSPATATPATARRRRALDRIRSQRQRTQPRHPRAGTLPPTPRRSAPTHLSGRSHPRRSPRPNPPTGRRRDRHLAVRHEITRPAWPPPTPRPPHYLLCRAHRQHWRDPLLTTPRGRRAAAPRTSLVSRAATRGSVGVRSSPGRRTRRWWRRPRRARTT